MQTEWIEMNRANWNERARAHLSDPGEFYDLAAVRAGGCTLLPLERELLGELHGKRLLHLMCHIGLDSICLARRGASVTAVDLSPQSIASAKSFAAECGVSIDFHVGDVHALPEQLGGDYDIAVMTYGVLCWIGDLRSVFTQIAARLKPGGRFVLIDGHPLLDLLTREPLKDGFSLCGDDYFHRPAPERIEKNTSYTGGAALKHASSFQWGHSLAETLQAVLDAGFCLKTVREERYGFYQRFPGMQKHADGTWVLPPGAPGIPLLFGLLAERK
ncbi:MAG TPA: methyltransferase domain-containing protein [Planctomycetota bacterium]|nr:methyltransferase domain-containing protein [Planctomycetota bacterium]